MTNWKWVKRDSIIANLMTKRRCVRNKKGVELQRVITTPSTSWLRMLRTGTPGASGS